MSLTQDAQSKPPEVAPRYKWSIVFDKPAFFLDEPITGYINFQVQDVYFGSTIKLNLKQQISSKVGEKTISFDNYMLKTPLQLLSDAPRTQFCMGRHFLPFEIKTDAFLARNSSDKDNDQSMRSLSVFNSPQESHIDNGKSWLLPSLNWEHEENNKLYTGTARSGRISVQYTVECSSLCSVRGSVEQIVATSSITILGASFASFFHSISLNATFPVNSTTPEKLTLKSKFNKNTYHHGDDILIHLKVSNKLKQAVTQIHATLLNSIIIRDPNDNIPTIHTCPLNSACSSQRIEPNDDLKTTISIKVNQDAFPTWLAHQGQRKIRIESILRITVNIEGISDHIFQTSLSISADPKIRQENDEQLKSTENNQIQQGKRILWVKDSDVSSCASCTGMFSFLKRRHHCRGCGQIVCDAHSKAIPAPTLFGNKPRRVCDKCRPSLQLQTKTEPENQKEGLEQESIETSENQTNPDL